jgi:hypothetical protein
VTPRTPARAEVVGSLLRPPALKAAVEAFYEPGHSAALAEERARDRSRLTELEDEAIRAAVRRQIDIGLRVASPTTRSTQAPEGQSTLSTFATGSSPVLAFPMCGTSLRLGAPRTSARTRQPFVRPKRDTTKGLALAGTMRSTGSGRDRLGTRSTAIAILDRAARALALTSGSKLRAFRERTIGHSGTRSVRRDSFNSVRAIRARASRWGFQRGPQTGRRVGRGIQKQGARITSSI